MIDLDKIEAAAKAATPGPWDFIPRTNSYINIEAPHQLGYAKKQIANTSVTNHQANAAHIATANPAAVLEMVSMIRERDAVLKQALEALEAISSGVCEAAHHAKKDRHELGILCPIEKRHDEAIAAIKEVLG